ncbi:MAG: YihY/virulence factor BrkB family protein [Gammaproteobacteria bacterium]|nr:YihY/virulence factor BrkB family protein [Gammaproteobacteria bacterium]
MSAWLWNLLDQWLFGERSRRTGPLPAAIRLLRYPYAILRDLSRGQVNLRAMGLVYMTLLSVVPLLAFSFAILKGFGAHRALEPIVYEFFRPVGTSATELTRSVMRFADSVSGGLVGSVGFALLVWTLLGTIRKVEDSFNFLWRVEQPRSFARRLTEYLGLLIVGPLLPVGFIGLSHAAMQSAAMRSLRGVPLMQELAALGLELSPYFMVAAMFAALYMFVPNTKVRIAPALIGGVTAGVLWAAIGKLFTTLVVASTRLTIVYAGFALIVAALLWTYFGWLILLIGAQISFYAQNPNYLRLGLTELRLANGEIEELALKIMYLVGRGHVTGETHWTVDELARALGMPGLAIARIVTALEGGRLLIATDDERLLPGRDVGHIPLHEIMEVARSQRSGQQAAPGLRVPAVERLSARLETAWRTSCGERTLRDLLEESA